MDITIVTSCHNYGQYLKDWAESIVKMTTHPKAVVMVDNGSTDNTFMLMEDAAKILNDAGIEVDFTRIDRTDFGSARNEAVRRAKTTWVQHLDADDMAMEHMLDDCASLAAHADVIALGYQRCGDLDAGPANLRRVYRDSQGASTLKSTAPASGVSPFRRSFWEQSPYRTDMDGGWDTALWLGFAHLNARFVATRRPCFWYRQHADSIFNTRRKNLIKGKKVGTKLQSLRRGDVGVSLIVPFRPDGGWRDQVWGWIRQRYEKELPGWDIILADSSGEAWNKGEAVNAAVAKSTGRVLVIADADCVIDPEALKTAAQLVEDGKPWVMPHRKVCRLSEDSTRSVLDQDPVEFINFENSSWDREPYDGYPGGGFIVVERAKFDYVQGFPTEFTGWGAEDEAFAMILDTMLGNHVRLEYNLWHLWHAKGKRAKSPEYQANRRAAAKYEAVRGNIEAMWALLMNRDGESIYAGIDTFPYKGYQPNPATIVPSGVITGYTLPLTRMDIAAIQEQSRRRTLQIREEQRRRNEEAQLAHSFQQKALAQAGRKVRSEMERVTQEQGD